jgi:hypothetical protein
MMWTRKSQEDFTAERRDLWKAFSDPILVFVLVCVVGLVSTAIGPNRPGVRGLTSWEDALVGSIAFGLLAATIAYSCQLVFGRRFQSLMSCSTYICTECHRVKSGDDQSSCECGGTFEDIGWWKWVEDGPGDDSGSD